MTRSWFAPQDPPIRREISGGAWKSVLLPLDGSALSRWAVARARFLLERPGTTVTLLRVIECAEDRANDLAYQMDSRHWEACRELAEVRATFAGPSGEVNADVRFGDPATEILREIAEGHHDVVLMSTYGRAGLGRALIGNVAQRILRSSPIPSLLFRPPVGHDGPPSRSSGLLASRFKRVLVALDGSQASEEILPAAARMATTMGSELHLFRAVSGGERLESDEYLRNWARSLASQGVAAEVNVCEGGAAKAALALIRERGLDAIALSTQARTGLARAMHGSVALQLLRGSDVPILTLCHRRHRLPMPASALEHRHVRVG